MKKLTPLQIAVHLGAWFPLAWLLWDYVNGNLSVNPIQDITQRTGKYALILLLVTLTVTPVNTWLGFRQVVRVRRPLGLYTFFYASLHFLTFIGLDYGFDWTLLPGAIFEKPFVLVGLAALTILLALAFTSFKYWQKRLGKNWKRLHRLVYLAGGLVIVHFAWAKKGNLLGLAGDILQPLLFGLVLVLLLAARLPVLRRRASALRSRLARPRRGPEPASRLDQNIVD